MTFDVLDPIDPQWMMFYVGTVGLVHLSEGLRMFELDYSFQIAVFACCLRMLVSASIFICYYLRDTYTDWRTIMLMDFIWSLVMMMLMLYRMRLAFMNVLFTKKANVPFGPASSSRLTKQPTMSDRARFAWREESKAANADVRRLMGTRADLSSYLAPGGLNRISERSCASADEPGRRSNARADGSSHSGRPTSPTHKSEEPCEEHSSGRAGQAVVQAVELEIADDRNKASKDVTFTCAR